jgi:hypothetical protein
MLVVREEEKVKGDLASTLGDSQRIRRLRGGARGCGGKPWHGQNGGLHGVGFGLWGGAGLHCAVGKRRLARGARFAPVGLGPGQAGLLQANFKRIWPILFLWTGSGKPFSNIPKIIQISI